MCKNKINPMKKNSYNNNNNNNKTGAPEREWNFHVDIYVTESYN